MRSEDPFHLRGLIIRGFDEDPEEGDDKDKDKETEDEDDDEKSESKDGDKEKDTTGLKSALEKERADRKRLEKEAKALRKFKEDSESKDKTDSERATEKATKAEEKATRLAGKLRAAALENMVTKVAGKLKFTDAEDALRFLDMDSITIDQDDDDPSEITIDEKSVERALKTVADKKPYLIGEGSSNEKSGSKFGGGRKDQKDLDDEALKEKYPALRNI